MREDERKKTIGTCKTRQAGKEDHGQEKRSKVRDQAICMCDTTETGEIRRQMKRSCIY